MLWVQNGKLWQTPVFFPKVTTVNSDRRSQWQELGFSRPPVLYDDFLQYMAGEGNVPSETPSGSVIYNPSNFPGGLVPGGALTPAGINITLPTWVYTGIRNSVNGRIPASVFFGWPASNDGYVIDPNGRVVQTIPFDDLYRGAGVFAPFAQALWMNF